jgi:hypothetical protein
MGRIGLKTLRKEGFKAEPVVMDLKYYLWTKMQAVLSLFTDWWREESPGNIEHLAS